jgi:transcriptional regulator with XRE-family HTH domain
MSIKIYWGSLLRAIRVERHLTQDEVANILHIKRQVYSYIECGKTHPTAEELAILSNVYDLDLYRYALKCMPVDYVAEQIEFRTYINSTGLESERKKLRKEKKMKEALEALENTNTSESKEPELAKKKEEANNINDSHNYNSENNINSAQNTNVISSYNNTNNDIADKNNNQNKTRQKTISVTESDIYASISALEAENRFFDSIINADKTKDSKIDHDNNIDNIVDSDIDNDIDKVNDNK